MNPERSERIEIPVLPLRDVVVYPHMVIPLFVGSIAGVLDISGPANFPHQHTFGWVKTAAKQIEYLWVNVTSAMWTKGDL